MQNPAIKIIASITFAFALIVGVLILTKSNSGSPNIGEVNNVNIVEGTQIIEITAKGGYSPRKSVAKAGVPTILRFETSGTFDCSSSVIIPSLNIAKQLAFSGQTDIDLGMPALGNVKGSCGMGMYPFEIDFD